MNTCRCCLNHIHVRFLWVHIYVFELNVWVRLQICELKMLCVYTCLCRVCVRGLGAAGFQLPWTLGRPELSRATSVGSLPGPWCLGAVARPPGGGVPLSWEF